MPLDRVILACIRHSEWASHIVDLYREYSLHYGIQSAWNPARVAGAAAIVTTAPGVGDHNMWPIMRKSSQREPVTPVTTIVVDHWYLADPLLHKEHQADMYRRLDSAYRHHANLSRSVDVDVFLGAITEPELPISDEVRAPAATPLSPASPMPRRPNSAPRTWTPTDGEPL
jgi:hypothetical protein